MCRVYPAIIEYCIILYYVARAAACDSDAVGCIGAYGIVRDGITIPWELDPIRCIRCYRVILKHIICGSSIIIVYAVTGIGEDVIWGYGIACITIGDTNAISITGLYRVIGDGVWVGGS